MPRHTVQFTAWKLGGHRPKGHQPGQFLQRIRFWASTVSIKPAEIIGSFPLLIAACSLQSKASHRMRILSPWELKWTKSQSSKAFFNTLKFDLVNCNTHRLICVMKRSDSHDRRPPSSHHQQNLCQQQMMVTAQTYLDFRRLVEDRSRRRASTNLVWFRCRLVLPTKVQPLHLASMRSILQEIWVSL